MHGRILGKGFQKLCLALNLKTKGTLVEKGIYAWNVVRRLLKCLTLKDK